jgi:prepilin peptidase CpaA
MNVLSLALLIFPLLMAFAAASDLLTMRISNILVLLVLLAFILLALIIGMPWQEMLTRVGFAAIVLVVAFAFFAFGWIGGGDAKLAAAITLWIDLGLMLPYYVYAALLGGALTLIVLALRARPLPAVLLKMKWLDRLHDPKQGVPYGIALAAAALLVYSQTSIFQHFMA